MVNVTSRIAVSIRYLPEEAPEYTTPQGVRNRLDPFDLLPSPEDGIVMEERAVNFISRYLVTHFDSLANLQSFAPKESYPHPVIKSEVVPMKILEKDEKYIHQTVDILERLAEDATLSGKSEVKNTKLKINILLAV